MDTKEEESIILQIRDLAGRLGADNTLEKAADAEEYDFQVQIGLARAVADILEYEASDIAHWFGYCLTDFTISRSPERAQRVEALLKALWREICHQQDEDAGESESDDADDGEK